MLGAERKITKSSPVTKNLLEKLDVVCQNLQGSETVANMSKSEADWIEDSFDAKVLHPLQVNNSAPFVLFSCYWPAKPSKYKKGVVLLGSAAYLRPRDANAEGGIKPLAPGSHWKYLNDILSRVFKGEPENIVFSDELSVTQAIFSASYCYSGYRHVKDVKSIRIRSLFRVLHSTSYMGLLLGTPLYVELL